MHGIQVDTTVARADLRRRPLETAERFGVGCQRVGVRPWAPEMDEMMREHLDRTTEEVVARHNSDWTADVAAYEKVHAQALAMADMLSDAIIANFPSRFRP